MAQYMQDFIFNHGSDEDDPKKRSRKRFWLRTIALLILIFFMFGQTIEYASKLAFKSMMLNLFGEEMELPELTPIDFDMDSFWDSTALSFDEKGENLIRSCSYESSEEMYEATGILWTESEAVRYDDICLMVYTKEKNILLTALVQCDSCEYELNATFLVEGYSPEGLVAGFEQGELASYVYEGADGELAYFVREWGFGTYSVYFVEDNILYRLTIPSTEEDVENAERVVEVMVE